MHNPLLALLLGLLLLSPAAHAELKPLWEAGLGAFATTMPSYRGANSYETYLLPLAYVVYRGKFLKSDREGVRGVFYDAPKFELNLSANVAPPVDSGSIPAREGMPNLDPSFEVGPSLQFHIHKTRQLELDLRWTTRAVFTFGFDYIGWLTYPHLNLDAPDVQGSGWNLGFAIGPTYGDRGYHRYYYDVKPQYATSTRPAYRAPAGYSGTTVYLTASKRFNGYWGVAYIRYDNLASAAFKDSPLLETDQYLAAGIGIAWVFGESKRLVEVDESGY
ncbi:MAG: MipA/OmpV family protein [Gammaproteobacteria bacterium]|jgi:outer membrane protein